METLLYNPIRIWARQRGRSRLIADVIQKFRGRFARDSQPICGRNVRFCGRSSAVDRRRSPPNSHARSPWACRGQNQKKCAPWQLCTHIYIHKFIYIYELQPIYIYINSCTYLSYKAATGRMPPPSCLGTSCVPFPTPLPRNPPHYANTPHYKV